MAEAQIHSRLVLAMFGLGLATFASLFFVTAPYGRHQRAGWGPGLPSRLGWIVMESPAVLFFLWVFARGEHRAETVPLIFLAIWQFHYVQRTFLFPFRMRIAGKRMPVAIAAMAFVFNCLNAYINARWVSQLGVYGAEWLGDPRFVGGIALFVGGWLLNVHSDTLLLRLRAPGESGYRIPRGGLHEWVASPNYLGEIVEWLGWALMTWSLAGLSFAFFTIANLAPRAIANRRWYGETFPEYPPTRKALIPYIW